MTPTDSLQMRRFGEADRLALAAIDANFLWTQHLLRPLANHCPTLFLKPVDFRGFRNKGFSPGSIWRLLSQDGYQEKRLVFPPGWFSRFSNFSMPLVRRSVERWFGRQAGRARVAIITFPQYVRVLRDLEADLKVYYWSDDFYSYWPDRAEEVERLEAEAVRICDLVVTTSNARAEELKAAFPERAGRIHNVIHGHHPGLQPFARRGPASLPADVDHLKRPIFGHWGQISDYLDFRLLRDVAEEFPEASFLLIGPVNDNFSEQRPAYEACREMPNVHFAGPRPYPEILSYVPSFDVSLILYRTDTHFTRSIYPLKIGEYLASGRPVVSTPVRDVVHHWDSLIFTGSGPAEYAAGIRQAMGNVAGPAVESYTRRHCWPQTSHRLLELILHSLTQARDPAGRKFGTA